MPIGELISVGTAFCWTLTVISFESAGKKVGSLSVNIIRLFFGLILLTVTLFITTGLPVPIHETGYVWYMLIISGFIGLVIGDLFLFQAFVDIGGRISLLIYSTVPVITALFGFFLFDETPTWYTAIGMALILGAVSMAILSKRGDDKKIHPHILKGVVFASIGAVAQAVGLVFSKYTIDLDVNAFAATQIRVMAATVGFIIYIFIKKEWGNVSKAFKNKRAISWIAVGSVFGPFLGVTSSLWALRYTQLGISTTISQLNVILIIPFSYFLFKEKVKPVEIVAAFIAFGGAAILFLS